MVPVFTTDSLDGGGARLCPCGLATPTPQHFTVAFAGPPRAGPKFPPLPAGQSEVRAAPDPKPPGLSRYGFEGRFTPVPRVLLSITLAGPAPSGSTGTPRRCQDCSHPPQHLPGQAVLSFTVLLRQDQRRRSLTPARINSASRRTGWNP